MPVTNNSFLKTGFTVSTKHFKKAVDRNRIRRLMKEGYRLQKNDLQKCLEDKNKQVVIFIIYTAKEIPVYTFVVEKITAVLQRLQKIVNENNSANS